MQSGFIYDTGSLFAYCACKLPTKNATQNPALTTLGQISCEQFTFPPFAKTRRMGHPAQLYAHGTDPAANIATGTALLKLKVGYAKGNVQNGLDMYGTGAPYGQNRLACANKP